MQHHNFKGSSELVTFAAYDPNQQQLFLTYTAGGVTIAYQNVAPVLYEELLRSAYPDVCIRFKVQARHAFRRIEPAYEPIPSTLIK
ncbi:hypothetical protein LEM8419_01412 [Neolewinella maritima]|uniref:KTSC domain-containing protein n=1 Tax=Neolewinella maritima TaxID=1383882 RepID=A0ABN8F5P3_9BACT|nr:hypothetical protein [Neolewinella maritima]CAH1000262.1 hypothetical protein LEM8419_01412 [Neolewinella maritima]